MLESRPPYARKSYDDEADYGDGLLIGSQIDPETLRRQKLNAQKFYQQQLEDDQYQKYREGEKDFDSQRQVNYSSREDTNVQYDKYGGDARRSNYSNDSGEPSQGVGLIGSHRDPEDLRKMKIMAQKSYVQQLADDQSYQYEKTERSSAGRRRTLTSQAQAGSPNNSLNIGSFENFQQDERRQEAIRIAERNREDAYARSLEKDSLEKPRRGRQSAQRREVEEGYGEQANGGKSGSRPPRSRDRGPDREADQLRFEQGDSKLLNMGQDGSERLQRRQLAADMQQLNRQEAQQRAQAAPRRDRDQDLRAIEEAEYKHIGSSGTGRSASSGRRGQTQYAAQLQADSVASQMGGGDYCGTGRQGQQADYGNSYQPEQYSYRSQPEQGRRSSGGGPSQELDSIEAKYLKQAEYRRLLDQQRIKDKDVRSLEARKYGDL